MPERGTVTLADVAERAGVSLATASRALNGSTRKVRQESVDRVRAAARALRYTANVQAQAVARGSTTTLALVVGDIADPYFAAIAAGAIRAADDAGLVVTITSTGGDPSREVAVLDVVAGLRPRAVVLAVSRRLGIGSGSATGSGPSEVAAAVGGLVAAGAEVSALVSDLDGAAAGVPGVHGVVIRNLGGAAALAGALVEQGHDSFAVLAGDPDLVTAHARVEGFVAGLAAHGLRVPDDDVVPSEFTRDGGYRAMVSLLDRAAEGGAAVPRCVFAVTDLMAVGAVAAIRERGLVPGVDVGVAGFDDVRMLADVVPALSTVRLPLEEIGERAVRRALGLEADGAVDGEVVLRASTAR
ncbi:LacI family DNA-binding transcriptional regulator [Curtobacterium poinsettiae]|uniref:LacI family DNA-binding transcriptional regulator n=1 Tax=Curtobacterium poinsettiae TaxID=159612 RepID=A0ABT3S6B0_9MICO|nr:LacI family DNA-binding transcriptional regulator [Curtobacterium flaccumfaciens]MBT1611721.1 LacI family transcriptional regulator [Curtobacterium flaccumfaciens pv. poinsettiae]MCX2850367.1 LacI family DNA-binding transcriptional regulator [Curtobacterium flaccumfaciens pv. poinsettiae]UXN16977.1 LacI family transcriptional regulator [Curtobacterium flaccumfaciens pv. poinsettiae]